MITWDLKEGVAKPHITKCNKVAAITDGEIVVKRVWGVLESPRGGGLIYNKGAWTERHSSPLGHKHHCMDSVFQGTCPSTGRSYCESGGSSASSWPVTTPKMSSTKGTYDNRRGGRGGQYLWSHQNWYLVFQRNHYCFYAFTSQNCCQSNTKLWEHEQPLLFYHLCFWYSYSPFPSCLHTFVLYGLDYTQQSVLYVLANNDGRIRLYRFKCTDKRL